MEYAVLGRTGERVSRIGFGGATAGLKDYLREYDPDRDEAQRTIVAAVEKALELGITYFDTAPAYGAGRSERLIGEGLASAGDDVFVATKVGLKDAEDVRASVEGSLRRLRRDQIDLLQIHGLSYSEEQTEQIMKPGGMLDQMVELKEEGLIRFIGFTSEDNNPPVYRFIEDGRFDMMQVCYNLLFQHPYVPSRPFGSFYEAEAQDMGIVVMRTMTSGSFQKWVQMVNPANEFDYNAALIQFVLSNPLVDVALIGMRSPERVIQDVEICENEEGRVDIDELYHWYV